LDISSNVLVFQKNSSWPEGRLGAVVMLCWFRTKSTSGVVLRGATAPGQGLRPVAAAGAGYR
jgi:hypothetical protein